MALKLLCKKLRVGSPQGAVISPLLANIYLNILDRLDLKLNQEKMQIRDARTARFEFLGFSAGLVKAPQSGKHSFYTDPK